jgi:hypothetical protein
MQYLFKIKDKLVETFKTNFCAEGSEATSRENNSEVIKTVNNFHHAIVKRLSMFRNIQNVINLNELKEPLLYVPMCKKEEKDKVANQNIKVFYQNITILDHILNMISAKRFNDVHENFVIGCCLYFETDGDDLGLLLWLKHLKCHENYNIIYNKIRKFYHDLHECTYELCVLTLIFMAAIDSPEEFQKLCDRGYI